MSQRAIYVFAFLMSFTAAQAQEAQNYISTAAIIDSEFSFDNLVDSDINSGFILSYGHFVRPNSAVEISMARYNDSGNGILESDISAFEISGVFHFDNGGPFLRLGFSDGDLKSPLIDLNTFEIIGTISESESGPVIGVGFDLPVANNLGAIRFEYNQIDYDSADVSRLTIGTFVRF